MFLQPSSRFRVGGRAEKRLNKTEVEEIISEHFVTEVEKFRGPEINIQIFTQGNSSNSLKIDYVMDVCPGLHCSHSCLFNYTLLKQAWPFKHQRMHSSIPCLSISVVGLCVSSWHGTWI